MSTQKKHKQTKPHKIGHVMLVIVIILYVIAAMNNSGAVLKALQSTLGMLQIIAPILLIVIFIIALINKYLHPKKLSHYLGEESGVKGWFIATIAGVLSHGPGYVWYPMLSELRSHGVKDGLIVTFIYARSVKLPWLPVMIGYFGIAFTIMLTLMTLIGAIVQGMIAQRLLARG